MSEAISMVSPLSALDERARLNSNEPVLIFGDSLWTVGMLLGESDHLSRALAARGVRFGDRIALHMHNIAEAVVGYLACFRVGAIAVPLNTRFKTEELAHWIERTTPSIYIGQHDLYQAFADVPQRLIPDAARYVLGSGSDIGAARSWAELRVAARSDHVFPTPALDTPAALLGTSGTTTGRSKLVVWTHRTLASLGISAAAKGFADGSVRAVLTPLMHAAALSQLTATFVTPGCKAVLMPQFEPGSVLDTMERHRCTALLGLPFMCAALAQHQKRRRRDLSALRICMAGGDTCSTEITEAFAEQFDRPLLSVWASTEVPGATVPADKPGLYSGLTHEAEIRVVDEAGETVPDGEIGEMWLKSTSTTPGYWEDGTIRPLPDGFFRSGDLVRMTGPREFQYMGRKKDLIVRGGSNISPLEVEAILQDCPNVREAAVAGIPDSVLGQRVGALLVLDEGTDIAAILAAVKTRLADYKVPEIVALADRLPRNALTKVDRNAVAAAVAREAKSGMSATS